MAQEWYVQHAGKQYGPLTAANLKKLAADGKITPATQVRSGTAGNWVAAGRVQGLFAVQTAAPSGAAKPPSSTQTPPLGRAASPPAPPPVASPLARVPLGAVAPVSKASGAESSIAPKIAGAVGLIFGILALATFWLPMLGGPMGWTGILVGALGLVLGIAGLVLSAMQQGSGLYLNVAGTSSAAVGLVLTVVLGVTFGMFAGKPVPEPVVVVRKPVLPPVEQPPPVEVTPPAEPEPPLEPVWTDASQAIEQGPIHARIVSVGIENIRLESANLATLKRGKPQPMLRVRVAIENTSDDKIVQVPGWPGGTVLGDGVDVSALLKASGVAEGAETAKTLDSVTAGAKLVDSAGNEYGQTPAIRLSGPTFTVGEDSSLRPGIAVEKEVVFGPPLPTIEYLRLELAPGGFGGIEPLRFQIPKAMIAGL